MGFHITGLVDIFASQASFRIAGVANLFFDEINLCIYSFVGLANFLIATVAYLFSSQASFTSLR